MINFIDINTSKPYLKFVSYYDKAIKNQKNIEAMSISSYSTILEEVNSRFVNLKFIDNDSFIFFRIIIHLNLKSSEIMIKSRP